jgi:beta-glucosidase
MVRGYPQYPYVGNVIPNSRLNIPALTLEDGPQGVADGVKEATCWPSALTVVASWYVPVAIVIVITITITIAIVILIAIITTHRDVEVMYNYSQAMAWEQRVKGTNVMLGPMVNIARVPMGGRNFESFGEDPYLSSMMVVPSVQGIQSQGVIATVKHFADNNQELNRTLTSANVDRRTQWEIYYPAFQAAIDAGDHVTPLPW